MATWNFRRWQPTAITWRHQSRDHSIADPEYPIRRTKQEMDGIIGCRDFHHHLKFFQEGKSVVGQSSVFIILISHKHMPQTQCYIKKVACLTKRARVKFHDSSYNMVKKYHNKLIKTEKAMYRSDWNIARCQNLQLLLQIFTKHASKIWKSVSIWYSYAKSLMA